MMQTLSNQIFSQETVWLKYKSSVALINRNYSYINNVCFLFCYFIVAVSSWLVGI